MKEFSQSIMPLGGLERFRKICIHEIPIQISAVILIRKNSALSYPPPAFIKYQMIFAFGIIE